MAIFKLGAKKCISRNIRLSLEARKQYARTAHITIFIFGKRLP